MDTGELCRLYALVHSDELKSEREKMQQGNSGWENYARSDQWTLIAEKYNDRQIKALEDEGVQTLARGQDFSTEMENDAQYEMNNLVFSRQPKELAKSFMGYRGGDTQDDGGQPAA